ncbi:speedy protein 1-B-like [Ranitomeya imitator]|uniref:speedy protein 1-B-like n=1 Tax=Ranitomeya imitator TaxID=111125 RepID=UPI0037E9B9CE
MAMRKRKRELIAQYEEECSLSATQEVAKRRKTEDDIPQPEERAAFAALLEEEYIRRFLARDSCLKISDKYLLAMVFTYFRRAGLRSSEYGTFFFPALFLANQFEEDVPYQQEIYRWALRWTWSMTKDRLLQFRNVLLTRMGFRAWVDRATCDLIMAQDPDHWAWKRDRNIHHSWAIRWFRRNNALPCSLCNIVPLKKEEDANI